MLYRNYLKHELEAGTPFTVDGANELRKLGIISIAISVISNIIISIFCYGKIIFKGCIMLSLSCYTSFLYLNEFLWQ